MLYWRYSPERTFFLSEYWIFIPSAILANYLLIRKIRSDRKRVQELEKLRNDLHDKKILLKILALSLGFNGCRLLLSRGGSIDPIDFIDLIDTDYITCDIERGLGYLNDARLRNIITNLYRHKEKSKVIYITATAACHLANRYGQKFLALPIAVGDFGLTSLYQTLRKGFVTILLGGVGPMIVIGNPVSLMVALLLGTSGLRLAFSNLDLISTSPVDITKGVEPRIPGTTEVVIVNNRDKITMHELVPENQECWLPDQHLLNPKCQLKVTEVPDAIDSALPNLRYKDTVNMQDTTGLDRVEFTDKFDLGQPKPNSCNPLKGKEVNFLKKFRDSGPIGDSEGWDTCDNDFMVPEKKYLRTRNQP